MTRLQSEFQVPCPCCGATLIIDANLRRVVGHEEPRTGPQRDLDDVQRLLNEEAARREALFEQSFRQEKERDTVLDRRFREALEQAKKEPVTRPTRDFDLE
jgi:tRNA(Arg) A34 adenosine deaminase TadA